MSPTGQPGNGLPDNLPLLTQMAEDALANELPTLTEVVMPAPQLPPAGEPDDETTRQLLELIGARLEAVFAQQLGQRLETLQRQAIEQAVGEFRAELPGLLRDALKAHPGL